MRIISDFFKFVSNQSLSRADRTLVSEWWWTIDRTMIAALLVLVISGVLLIAAASPPVAERIGAGHFHFLIKHMIILVPGMVMLIGVSFFSPKYIWRIGTLILIGSVLAMIAVLLFGMEIKGAKRWLHLPGFSLQPSEFLKVGFAIVCAWCIAQGKDNEFFPGQILAACLFALCAGLLLLQPDLGMTVVLSFIYGVQLFLSGFPMALFIGLALAFIGCLVGAYFIFDHVQSRIDRFFNPDLGDNFQVQKSIEAFQNGGVFGTGPGQGSVKLVLPDAHADFIFSVAAEEMGAIFTCTLVALYLFVVLRGANRALGSNDIFIVTASAGLLTMFGVQALIHMGSSLHLLPAKGMTLPFISYGGSSFWAISIAMGVVLGLTRRQGRTSIAKGGSLFARRKKAVI